MAVNKVVDTKVRSICWTLNNYIANDDTPETGTVSTRELDACSQVTYNVYGREVGENGTRHLQGYTEFKTAVRFSVIRKLLPGAHIEPRYKHSTAAQAAAYCKKGEQLKDEWLSLGTQGPNYGLNRMVCEFGAISLPQGYRTDIMTATAMIDEGIPMSQVAKANPETFVKFHKGLIAYQAITIPKRTQKPRVRVFYGPTGCGKTRKAFEEFEGKSYYVWGPSQGTWFDGYEGQANIIFDEFRSQFPLGEMLRLLDRYEHRVQYKGGCCQFNGQDIIITSPCDPHDWYQSCGDDRIDQLLRRIDEIVKMDAPVKVDKPVVSADVIVIDDLA